jgi:hypothetical protein
MNNYAVLYFCVWHFVEGGLRRNVRLWRIYSKMGLVEIEECLAESRLSLLVWRCQLLCIVPFIRILWGFLGGGVWWRHEYVSTTNTTSSSDNFRFYYNTASG